jgi:diguanylate cyclase (GGDEF)-like protein
MRLLLIGITMSTNVHHSTDVHDTLSSGSIVRKPQVANSALESDTAVAQHESNIQLKITSLLQTTLKLEPLFDLFFGQLQHLLKINSCAYSFQDKNITVKLGKGSTHTTDYSLRLQDTYLGNIVFSRKQRFTTPELEQLEGLLSILIYPLRNTLSYRDAIQQALSDPLTGLANRGALEQAIAHQWQMAQRYDQHFCVLMLDIDLFKNINDTYGHGVGDNVIKAVANSISDTTRQTDVAYRYGGEEFVVILNKSELSGAMIIAERIRENVAALSVPIDKKSGKKIGVTISIGGSCSAYCSDTNELMQQADKVLYCAKNAGRNRVEFSSKEGNTHTKRDLLVTTDGHQH